MRKMPCRAGYGVSDLGYPYEDRDDHVLVAVDKGRQRIFAYHVGIGSEEFIQAQIFIEICGDRIPPVKKEILK